MSTPQTKYTATATDGSRLATIVKTKTDYYQVAPSRKHYADIGTWMAELTTSHPDVKFTVSLPLKKEMDLAKWTSLPEHIRTIHKLYDIQGLPNTLSLKGRRKGCCNILLTKRGRNLAVVMYNRQTNQAKWANGDDITDQPYDAEFYSLYTASKHDISLGLENVTLPADKHLIFMDTPHPWSPSAQRKAAKGFVNMLTFAGYHCVRLRPNLFTGTPPFWSWDFYTATHVRFSEEGKLETIKSEEGVNLSV
jgi:hypothetical protein